MANEVTSVSVAYRGMRNFHVDAYHYCARCGSRVKISDLTWQRGLLVCKKWDCYDTGNHGFPLIGQREADIAAILDVPSHELQPDDKLTSPSSGGSGGNDDIVF